MRKTIYVVLGIAVVIFSGALVSEAQANPKVASINVDELFDSYQKTVDLNEDLEAEIQTKQAERDQVVEDIRRMKDEMILLTEQNRKEKQIEIDKKISELQQYDEQTREELAGKRNEFIKDILEELDQKVRVYGEEQGFDYIFNSRLLLYQAEKYDITQDLLADLNHQYKSGKK